jgi:hypothetical protein
MPAGGVQSPGTRPCCMLAQFNFPLPSQDIILDATQSLGSHHYGGGDRYGLVYTCRGGFIDLGHLRDQADLTRYYVARIASGATRFSPYTYSGEVSLKQDVTSIADRITVARSLAFDESLFHEIETYWIVRPGSHNSSFSPEDLPSNFLGTYVAEKALQAGGDFDSAVTSQLSSLLTLLGGVDRATAIAALASIKGRWVAADLPLVPQYVNQVGGRYLQRRNFTRTPWTVPGVSGCADTTFPSSVPLTLPGDPSSFYTAAYDVPFAPHQNDQRQAKLGTRLTSQDFTAKIADIVQAAKATYGPSADQP